MVLDPSTFYPEHEPPAQNAIHLSTADLGSSFQTFRSQLLTLLGLPPLPPSISVGSPSSSATKFHQLSEWQLDALLRRRTLENIRDSKEALASIIKLVAQIENMPVGQDVKGDVQGALDAIEQVSRTYPLTDGGPLSSDLPVYFDDFDASGTCFLLLGLLTKRIRLTATDITTLCSREHTLVASILQSGDVGAFIFSRRAQVRGLHSLICAGVGAIGGSRV